MIFSKANWTIATVDDELKLVASFCRRLAFHPKEEYGLWMLDERFLSKMMATSKTDDEKSSLVTDHKIEVPPNSKERKSELYFSESKNRDT